MKGNPSFQLCLLYMSQISDMISKIDVKIKYLDYVDLKSVDL